MNKPAFSIPQFCDDHNLSRAFLYKLIKDGQGPRLMKIGRRTLISAEAAADWRAKMEQATDQTSVEV
ncbi:MAG: hypothetical protein WA924_06065 [Burkholderiaceae bacterium]